MPIQNGQDQDNWRNCSVSKVRLSSWYRSTSGCESPHPLTCQWSSSRIYAMKACDALGEMSY